jgi:hypothetical protein
MDKKEVNNMNKWEQYGDCNVEIIPVLMFMWGIKLDDVAWAYIHSMVSKKDVVCINSDATSDGKPATFKIFLDENDLIVGIEKMALIPKVDDMDSTQMRQKLVEQLKIRDGAGNEIEV